MTDYRNENINPEDFWPEAEKLIDDHFKTKRRRKAFILFIFLIISCSTTVYYVLKNSYSSTNTSFKNSTHIVNDNSTNKTLSNSANVDEKIPTNKSNTISNINKNNSDKTEIKSNQKNFSEIFNSNKPKTSSNKKTTINHSHLSTIANNNNIKVDLNTTSINTYQEPSSAFNIENAVLSTSLLPYSTFWNTTHFDSVSNKILVPPTKRKSRVDIMIYGGTSFINNNLTGSSNVSYIQRRNREEKNVILPHAGISISTGKGNWDFRSGFEFSVVGEKIKYSPYSDGDYFESYGDWKETPYSYTQTDSTFIFGNLYINTQIITVNDSTYIIITDTINGTHYNEAIQRENGINKHYYVEIPLEIAYTTFLDRWGLGISGGVSPAFTIYETGYYLLPDQSDIAKYKTKNSFQLNGRINLEFSYCVSNKLRIMLRPTGRMNLTTITDPANIRKHYNSLGLNIGAIFKLR